MTVVTLVIMVLLIINVLLLYSTTKDPEKVEHLKWKIPSQNNNIDNDDEVTSEMEDIILQLKKQIKEETQGYKLPSNRNVEDLFPVKGGIPVRSVVVSTWRSGSSFTAGVLNSHPATFYFCEPLSFFNYVQVRGEPLTLSAIQTIRNFFSCNYWVLGQYLEWTRDPHKQFLLSDNTRLWKYCSKNKHVCWSPQFLRRVCRLFPFQLMKTVHLRLRLAEQLLADPKLNVRVVYLVRDPRGIMESRSTLGWCQKHKDCSDPVHVCADSVDDYSAALRLNVRVVYLVRDPRGIMESRSTLGWCQKHEDCSDPVHVCADSVDDYSAALRFTKLFPDRFKVIRYEDLALRPDEVIPDMFKFFGLQYHKDVQQFVKTHTTQSGSEPFSIYRNSSATALKWRDVSKHDKVLELQRTCRVALSAWGYLPALNATHQLTFNPLDEQIKLL